MNPNASLKSSKASEINMQNEMVKGYSTASYKRGSAKSNDSEKFKSPLATEPDT